MSPPVQAVADDPALPAKVVVVVGAGIAGIAAAYELARKGHSVAVIEKGVVAGEQSSRNWGWCRQQGRDIRELPLAMWALRRWEELTAETGRDFGFRRTGLVYVTDRAADLARWEEWGEAARRSQMQTRMLSRGAGLSFAVGRSSVAGPEGFARWSTDAETPFERIRVLDPPPQRHLVDEALGKLGEAYPPLKGIAVARSWGGQIDVTPDLIPVISGIDPLPGLFVSAGFSGHGFGSGPAAGRLAADLVAGDPPIVDPHPYRYSRMTDGGGFGVPGMI